MALDYSQLRTCLRGHRLPAAFVDLAALDRNVDRVCQLIRPRNTPVRIASKSVRSVDILNRLIDRSGGLFRGLLCFAAEEAEFLAGRGFDDLLVAYPCYQRCDIERAIRLSRQGVTIRLMADCIEGVERLAQVAANSDATLGVVLCVDMSLRLAGGQVHLGVRRSPLRTPEQVLGLARYVSERAALRFDGIMGYEAQVAGLGDDNPFAPVLNPIKAMIRRASVRELGPRRRKIVDALCQAGLAPRLVNGGGSGSLDTTTPDTGITEVSAGSAFYKPHLFDYYRGAHMRQLEPASFFALEITRKPAANMVTCLGGGYVASGPASADKIPLPWLPKGLRLLSEEMCGEVQTPLRLARGVKLTVGDPVVFRHAKSGELAERFNELLLIENGRIVGSAKTYRGDGQCFL